MKISIIMVTYNAEKTIESSLLSLIKQDYKDKEIILIDGASTDRTMEIVDCYKDKIDYWISEPDEGIYDATNKGIEAATGDYIGFLNAGDWYINNHVLSNIAKSISINTGTYFGNVLLQVGSKWRKWESDRDFKKLYFKCSVASPASFVKREIFNTMGMFSKDYHSSGDYEFWLRLYTNGINFQIGDLYTTLMFDGGISSDPRRFAYKEDQKIAIKYGVSPIIAACRYQKNMIRHTLVRLLRKVKIDNEIKKFLGQQPLLSIEELELMGIDVENPWFLS